jgi:ribose 5-phosphate isomerase A
MTDIAFHITDLAANSLRAGADAIDIALSLDGTQLELAVTDNGCHILDASGLRIEDPKALEAEINAWPGVVTVGLFAARGADVLLLGTQEGVQTFEQG